MTWPCGDKACIYHGVQPDGDRDAQDTFRRTNQRKESAAHISITERMSAILLALGPLFGGTALYGSGRTVTAF